MKDFSSLIRMQQFGIWIYICTIITTVSYAYFAGLCNEKLFKQADSLVSNSNFCSKQYKSRHEATEKVKELIQTHLKRITYLKQASLNPKDPLFSNSIKLMTKEEQDLASQKKALSKYPFQPLNPNNALFWMTVFIWSFQIFIGSFITKTLLRDIHRFKLKFKINRPKIRPTTLYWLIVISIFFARLSRYCLTSIFDTEKVWFTWESYCVSPTAFLLTSILFFFEGMILAPPLCIWITLMNKELIPKIRIRKGDIYCGIRRYLLFVDKWMVLGLVTYISWATIWIHTVIQGGGQKWPYAIMPVFSFFILIAILLFGARNFHIIRGDYIDSIETYINNCGSVGQGLPKDPTITLVGEYWWKFVLIIIACSSIIAGALKVLNLSEWLGI